MQKPNRAPKAWFFLLYERFYYPNYYT